MLAAFLVALALQCVAGRVVHTPYGPVRGTVVNDTEVFRGIPFAAPPVGALRFKSPVPPKPWTEVRDATDFGPSCLQPGSPGTGDRPGWPSINVSSSSEDCLFLNIYRPATATGPLPVMVYFHAGEFHYGSSNDLENNFPYFSRDILLVTPNARIGPFGFVALDGLRDGGSTGNYGMLDQREALRWVQQAIHAFGGDPDRVTIFGESSGGTSVAYHLTNPKSHGLFHRAILESPGITQIKQFDHAVTNSLYLASSLAGNGSEGCAFKEGHFQKFDGFTIYSHGGTEVSGTVEQVTQACQKDKGCTAFVYHTDSNSGELFTKNYPITNATARGVTGVATYTKWIDETTAAQCLQQADALDLIVMSAHGAPYDDTFNTDQFAPVIDGSDITMTFVEALRTERVAKVQIIAGSNMDEGTIFMGETPPINCNASYEDFQKWAVLQYGKELGELVPKLYPSLQQPLPECYKPGNTTWYMTAMRSAGDSAILCRAREALLSMGNTSNVYQYYFTHTPTYSMNYPGTKYLGAFHGAEVPFVFGDQWELSDDAERQLSAAMGCYWASFAKTGDPNADCSAYAKWPAFQDNQGYLELGKTITAKTALNANVCDVFRKYP